MSQKQPSGSRVQQRTLTRGLIFGESPRWHNDRLWVADWGAKEILAVDREGKSEAMVRMRSSSFQPICFDWLPDSRLLIVSSSDRLLLRREADGSLATHADLTGLSDHGFNEVVVDGRSNAYVNGAGFNFLAGEKFAPGIVALVTPGGVIRRVAEGIGFPNGMAVTADNRTLIVADSYAKNLIAFDIAVDGGLSNRRAWADLGDGVPDGICLDADGAIWYGDVPNKRCVRVREGGDVLQVIDFEVGCFACMLGGPDGRTLFMVIREWRGVESTADRSRKGQVVTIDAPAPHAGWP